MKVIHMKVKNFASALSATYIEANLLRLAGVLRVAVISSPGLVSVMFDETRASVRDIVRSLRTLGVDVTVVPRASFG